ncbi:MAG: 5-formyltetrahydrofolate cyclo-ligase [Gammaproteobacteria bacterium]|nr:5-formyltetrahydrofolate cyclo-ligase [Gammaproteobacteria bacterium]
MIPPTPAELPSPAGWEEIRRWRKLTREILIDRRARLAAATRRALAARACARLAQVVDLIAYRVLGFCWPIRGELDARAIVKEHLSRGGLVALPVVVQKSAPVEFWRWQPGMPMQTGTWNIPIPATRDVLRPDVVVVPLVGFDDAGFRLGYGGGYFDRTLGAAAPRPLAIGFGYAESRLPTIHPQAHDIPMSLIVTEESSFAAASRT